jgi:SagB-type dehydrogenase family enzyme
MLPKIFLVLLPLAIYGLVIGVLVWRGRAPSRIALNVQTSTLLTFYLLSTASLGVFWVANQQLPAFDWHYLFGYSTVLLVSIHLAFNLPTVLRWLAKKPSRQSKPQEDKRAQGLLTISKLIAICGVLAFVFFLGMRQSSNAPELRWNIPGENTGPIQALIRYHEFSSESRLSVFRRAPGIDWGAPPPAFKFYPNKTHISLTNKNTGERGLSAMIRAATQRETALRLDELGELLYLSAGITAWRSDTAYRTAPSSGALFPSEVYVQVNQIQGLPAGLYHYSARHQQLDVLNTSATNDLGAPVSETADAVIILTSIFRRTGYKYRDRAYRYVMADVGHLLENVRIAGHNAGLQAQAIAQFDEEIAAETLGIDNVEEGVLAMLELRRTPGKPTQNLAATVPHFQTAAAPESTSIGVTGTVHRATSLDLISDITQQADQTNSIVLPTPVPTLHGVYQSITQRRSKRRFLDQPVALETLSSILSDMAQPAQLSGSVRINLIVKHVKGLSPGVYRYLNSHALRPVLMGDFSAKAQSAALSQSVIGDAAVVLVLSAERASMLKHGPRGYRHAFIEAGMISERWLLGAVARDLAACPVGAFYDDEAAALIDISPKVEWVLHFAALRRSAD